MATIAYLIHPNEIKATAYIDENVDEKYLRNAIRISQDLYIHPVIGTGIYDQLKTQINAGTVNSNNDTLLTTYIQPALKYWVLYEGIDMLHYKITNKAVMRKSSENAEAVSKDEILHLKEKFRNIAEWYTERIRLYLIENSATFTLYLNPGTGVDIIHPVKSVFDSGFYTDMPPKERGGIGKYEYPGTYCDE